VEIFVCQEARFVPRLGDVFEQAALEEQFIRKRSTGVAPQFAQELPLIIAVIARYQSMKKCRGRAGGFCKLWGAYRAHAA